MGVDFRVLGPLEVVVEGRAVALGGRQPRAILAMLVLRANHVVPTESLYRAVWGDEVPASAPGVLRTYVSRLRRALSLASGTRLTSRPPGYVLETDPEHVDAHRFSQLVREAHDAAVARRPEVASATLERALALWRGTALADLSDLDALRPMATRLEEARLAAMEDRLDAELALGHHAAIVGELEALAEDHPFRERLWGQLITALYRCGRQADALAAYQSVRTALVEEVGVNPGPELQALEQLVLSQADELQAPPAPGSPPLPLQAGIAGTSDDQRFVGRAAERALLAERLAAAVTGQFGLVFVAGPPGIGKTTLARWLAGQARAAGTTVVAGWADEGTGVPFQPLREAIDHWASQADPAALPRLAEADVEHLARFVPALAERRRSAPPPPSPASDAERQRVFEAVVRWVEAMAAPRPAVIVLEDLHWADPATLLAVRHLVRHPPAAGALLLATHRDTEIDDQHPLADVLSGTRGDDRVARIELPGLHDDDVADLIGGQDGTGLDAADRAFAAQLNRRTGGNPLFIHETLRHLERHGGIRREGPVDAMGVPPGVIELLGRRLRRLPAPTATVLQAAAALGQHFDVPVLSLAVDLPELAVLDALEPAVSAQLILPDGDGGDRYAFAHALAREAILDGMAPGRRVRLHWRAGQALASAPARRPEAHLGEIARHLAAGVRAGDPRTAAAANVRAGEQALSALAFEEAVARYSTAIDLLGTGDDSDRPDDGSLGLAYTAWLGLGQASGVLGDMPRQRRSYLQAAAIARRRHRPDDVARAAVALVGYGLVAGDQAFALAAIASAVDEALDGVTGTPTVNQTGLLAIKAVLAVNVDQGREARELAAAAADAARRLGDPTAEATALMARCWTLLGEPRPQELREAAERALAGVAIPEVRLLVWHLVVPLLARPALQVGDLGAVRALRERLSTTADIPRSGQLLTASFRTWDAAMALCQGRFDEAVQLATALRQDAEWMVWQNVSSFQIGLAGVERGDHDAAIALLSSLVPGDAWVPGGSSLRALLASLLAAAGDRDGALRQVELLRRRRPLDQLGWDTPFVLRHLAEVAARLGDTRLAADLLPVLAPYSGQMLVSFTATTVEGAADRARGQVLLALGRFDEATARLAAAQAFERSFEATALAARTAYWQARAMLARGAAGDHEAAGELLLQAASDARRLGMAQLATEIAALTPDPHR